MACNKNNSENSTSTTTASKGTIAIKIPAVIKDLYSIKHLGKGYLEKSKDLFALDEALKLTNSVKKEITGEQEDVEENAIDLPLPLDIDDELLIDQGLTVRTGGASGGNNLLIYGALAAAGIYLLFKN